MLYMRTSKTRIAFRALLSFAVCFIITGTVWLSHLHPNRRSPIVMLHAHKPSDKSSHPIDHLLSRAEGTFQDLLAKRTLNLHATAEAYRKRRGRHPPPGFDTWFMFAQAHNAVIVEDFFDQIYHDLNPFWGVSANEIRAQAKHYEHRISVRDGVANKTTDKDRVWVDLWHSLVASIQDLVPDVDIPINPMDESRVIVSCEDIDRYVKAEQESRRILPLKDVVTELTGLTTLDWNTRHANETAWIGPGHEPFWDTAKVGCPSYLPGSQVQAALNFSGPPPIMPGFPLHSYKGYVQNWTATKHPCMNPGLQQIHGTFIEPVSISTTHSLIPIFSGSKLPMNNDILVPAAMYWSDNEFYSGGKDHGGEWEDKTTGVMWRGGATGGRNRAENWTRFHRHRFVSMMNGTAVRLAEQNPFGAGEGPNFFIQSYTTYQLIATQNMDLGTWLESIANVGFVHLECFPVTGDARCPHTDPYYNVKHTIPMKEQYSYKILPDLDGNSFSGRYLAFLRSTSLPIKATIYSEWHDSRLIPWLHFVPMHNSFVDLYGILDYFLGTGVDFKTANGKVVKEGAHDAEARNIALKGKEWAEKVLRKEDMRIYMLRLLLEYARVSDDKREKLGFIGDLKEKVDAN